AGGPRHAPAGRLRRARTLFPGAEEPLHVNDIRGLVPRSPAGGHQGRLPRDAGHAPVPRAVPAAVAPGRTALPAGHGHPRGRGLLAYGSPSPVLLDGTRPPVAAAPAATRISPSGAASNPRPAGVG